MLERMRVMAGGLAALVTVAALAIGWVGAWTPEAEAQSTTEVECAGWNTGSPTRCGITGPTFTGSGTPAWWLGYMLNQTLYATGTAQVLATPCASSGVPTLTSITNCLLPGATPRTLTGNTDTASTADNGNLIIVGASTNAAWTETFPKVDAATGLQPGAFQTLVFNNTAYGGTIKAANSATLNVATPGATGLPLPLGTNAMVFADNIPSPGNLWVAPMVSSLVGTDVLVAYTTGWTPSTTQGVTFTPTNWALNNRVIVTHIWLVVKSGNTNASGNTLGICTTSNCSGGTNYMPTAYNSASSLSNTGIPVGSAFDVGPAQSNAVLCGGGGTCPGGLAGYVFPVAAVGQAFYGYVSSTTGWNNGGAWTIDVFLTGLVLPVY